MLFLRSPSPAATFCALAIIMTLSRPLGADEPVSVTESLPPAVKLVRPKPAGAPIERAFQGRVTAKDTLDLAFEVGGELVALPIVEGERLPRGARVALLDPAPFERAVRRAELRLEQSERALGRASQLAAGNAASRAAAEDAETARDLADVALAEAREALTDATLAAPFDALVATRLVAPHTVIAPGVPIARLQDLSETHVEIDVPERLVNALPSFDDVRFEALATAAPGASANASGDAGTGVAEARTAVSRKARARKPLELVGFETETGPVGQSYTVTLRLPAAPDDRNPLPGSSLTVVARLPAGDGTGLVLPTSALLSGDDRGTAVMVFEPGPGATGTVRLTPVEVGSRTGASLTVTGIGEGVEVVAAGAHRLQDGQRVRRWSGLVVAEESP